MIGVLEPSVPYPADTEIIANMVTSPHHLGATMITLRTHRMTELFGRLKPGVTIESARSGAGRAARGDDRARIRTAYRRTAGHALERRGAARSDRRAGAADAAGAAGRRRRGLHHRLLERREPDPRAIGAPRRRVGRPRRARRQPCRAAAHAAGRKPGPVRRRRGARRVAGAADGGDRRRSLRRDSRCARSRSPSTQPAVGRRRPRDGGRRAARLCAAAAVGAVADRVPALPPAAFASRRHQSPPARVCDHADRVLVRAAGGRGDAARRADRAADGATPATTCGRCWRSICRCRRSGPAAIEEIASTRS